MLGLACGDALGAPVEFKKRGSFEPITGMQGGGKFSLEKGQWTDDTSMALCLATSLIDRHGFDALDQMERYYQWANTGYLSSKDHAFGIGKTVFRALLKYRTTKKAYCGSTSSETAGNGALMRLAPVPLFFFPDKDQVINFSLESAKTTHGADECLEANLVFGYMLWSALSGHDKSDILHVCIHEKIRSTGISSITRGEYQGKAEDEISSSGYVVDSLEAALWCFESTDSFEEAVLQAVNLGHDADTVGAICGQIAGAFYGIQGIPTDWLNALYQMKQIQKFAVHLFENSLNRA